MKELNRASRHAARHTWQTGKLVKHTSRPRQTEGKPGRRDAERYECHAQPDEFVVGFVRIKPVANDSH